MNTKFGSLFKRFRLKSEFETLTSLADALAESGLIFENSTLSRWQNGSRIPKNRKILKTLISLFVKHGGISNLEQANLLMESTGLGSLTNQEKKSLAKDSLLITSPFQSPVELEYFVGREEEIRIISQKLINSGNSDKAIAICISGLAGIGKTALAINIAHRMRLFFPDGVLWSRIDTSNPNDILNKIAFTFKENINNIKSLETKAEIVRSLLYNKKFLLIFDNVEKDQQLKFLIPNAPCCSLLITTCNKNVAKNLNPENFSLKGFSNKETYQLFNKIIGAKLLKNKEIKDISKTLGFLPLALSIIARKIKDLPVWRTKSILKNLSDEQQRLNELNLENIGIRSSFNASFKNLNLKLKEIFPGLAVFSGEDFSVEALASINKLSVNKGEELLEKLANYSLVERSSKKRYRLHPLIKLFAQELIKDKKFYLAACSYYLNSFFKKRQKNKLYSFITSELENILGLFKWCLKNKENKLVIKLWDYVGPFLWDCGYWNEVYINGKKVCKIAKAEKNTIAEVNCLLKQLCWVSYWQHNIKEAEVYANKGLQLAKKLKDNYLVAFSYKRLGMIYKGKGLLKKAAKILKKALKFFERFEKRNDVLDILTYLGHIYLEQKDYEMSAKYYEKALKIANKINDYMGQSIILNSLGNLNTELGRFKVAANYHQKNLKAAKKAKSLPALFWHKRSLGLLELKRNKPRLAYNLLTEAYKKGQRLGLDKDLKEIKRIIDNIKF